MNAIHARSQLRYWPTLGVETNIELYRRRRTRVKGDFWSCLKSRTRVTVDFSRFVSQMLFSPRDYVISPAFPGYAVVQIHKSPEGLSPSFVTDYATWEEASRKVHLLALMEGVHAWARREG